MKFNKKLPFHPAAHNRMMTAGALVLLAGIVFLIYSNSLHSPFVFDDRTNITRVPAMHITELSWENIKTAVQEAHSKSRPLPNISFALNHYFHGLNVTGYHVVNISLHLMAGLFLFLFVRQTLLLHGLPQNPGYAISPEMLAFSAALIWIVNPVNTQAVTYIVQRMVSMAAMFFILSLLLYAWGRSRWRNHGRITLNSGLALSGCLLAGICAVISKQNAGMLPIIILLYEWFFFQDLSVKLSKKQVGWIIGGLAVFSAIALLYLGANPLDRILGGYARREFTLPERVMTEWRVIIYYIALVCYPFPGRLNLDHDYPLSVSLIQPPTTLPALGAIAALVILALYVAPRHRLIAFCLLWLILNLIIESSVISLEIIFEHRTYLPFMLMPLAAAFLIFRLIKPKALAIASVCIIALIFSFWTYQRNTTWQDEAGFARDRLLKSPNKARPNMEIGVYLAQAKKYDLALQYLYKALQLNPAGRVIINTYTNLGNVMVRKGRLKEAIDYYQKALAMDPDHQSARENMEKVKAFMEKRGSGL